MEKNRVPISIISRLAGHSTPEFTYRVYVHAKDDDLSAGRDTLSRRYGAAGEVMSLSRSPDAPEDRHRTRVQVHVKPQQRFLTWISLVGTAGFEPAAP
jgi:hypothetical protein